MIREINLPPILINSIGKYIKSVYLIKFIKKDETPPEDNSIQIDLNDASTLFFDVGSDGESLRV